MKDLLNDQAVKAMVKVVAPVVITTIVLGIVTNKIVGIKLKKQEENLLDKEIEKIIKKMAYLDLSSDEYLTAMKTLHNFYELKFKDVQGKHKRGVSPDTVVGIVANKIVGIKLKKKESETAE